MSWPSGPFTGGHVTPFVARGVRGEWLYTSGATADAVILYLHGGAYSMGSCKTHRQLAGRIGAAAGVPVFLPEYRLAPEFPYPAALIDTMAAYRWLLERGMAPGRIVLAGDSAGGGLAVAAAVAMRDAGFPLPAALVGLSAWTDLACTGESMRTRAARDPILTPAYLRAAARLYLAGADPYKPLTSPLYADLNGLPPMLLQVGADEILLDDSVRLAGRARAAHVAVTLEVWPRMWHVWQLAAAVLPESRQAIDGIGAFIRQQLQAAMPLLREREAGSLLRDDRVPQPVAARW